jgi:glycosyltransferase involved in cell wall biosynthesis
MSNNLTIDYSIIVPAYNEQDYLGETLDSLALAMKGNNFFGEIIVVDNNSTDKTAEIAKSKGAIVIFEPFNQIAKARNTGAKSARGRYLIFVDADTTISAELLNCAISLLSKDEVIGGGALVKVEELLPKLATLFLKFWTFMSSRFNFAAGCFLFCTKQDFQNAGGFPESVFASEELWLARELKKLGRFQIIKEHYAITSGRKIDTSNDYIWTFLLLGICPLALRSKRFCGFWYNRKK